MQRRLLLTTFAFVVLLAGAHPQAQVASPTAAGRLVERVVPSTALKSNMLGDPPEVRVLVYLPASYDTSPARRYPTLYFLHGYLGDERTFARALPAAADESIRRSDAKEMIIVLPNGRNAYFGSFYTNSPVTGGWEDFVAQELIAWVDGEFRTVTAPGGRGIAGHSMGGYGAIMLGMKHPEVFSAVYALSPCCVGLQDDIGPDNPAWVTAHQFRSRDQLQPKPQSPSEFFPTVFVALAAAFSPNPQNEPLYVDLPFVPRNNRVEPNGEAYARWRANMPLYLVEQYQPNLEKLRGIYVDYGALEEFSHIRSTTRAFSEALASRGIAHTFEVYAGGDHSNKLRERLATRVFRFFSEMLTFE